MSEGLKRYYETHDSYLKGKTIDRTIVKKQKAGRLAFYKNNKVWNFGRKHSKDTRKRISEGMKRYWNERKKEGR
jgi:hypothetical protein